MPEGSEFRSLWTPAAEAKLRQLVDGVQQRHGVRLIDARDWMPDDAFFDMHHLHGHAATAFSERLAREAVGPLLRSSVHSRVVLGSGRSAP